MTRSLRRKWTSFLNVIIELLFDLIKALRLYLQNEKASIDISAQAYFQPSRS